METVVGRLTSFAASAECITKCLEQENSSDDLIIKNVMSVNDVLTSQWMESFTQLKAPSSSDVHENFQLGFFSKQLEEVVIGLWNATVARQTSKTIEGRTCAVLRQLCYHLLTCPLCSYMEVVDPRHNAYMHRRIMMATKSGKAWLDLCEYQKAEVVLLKAKEDIETLQTTLVSTDDQEMTDSHEIIILNKYLAVILCYTAEVSFGLKQTSRSYDILSTTSQLQFLSNDDNEEYVSDKDRIIAMSYNFGLNATTDKRLHEAIKWLNFSFELAKAKKKIDGKLIAQTLRLLAHVYCETAEAENLKKALGAIELANNYYSHPAGLHLRLRIICMDSTLHDDVIKAVLLELLRHTEMNAEVGLSACRCLNKNGRFDLCEYGLKELLSRFTGSRHVGHVHTQRFQAAIERLPIQDAVDFADGFLEDRDVISTFDDESFKTIQLLLWEQASKCQEAGHIEKCLSWYNISLRLFLFGKSIDELKQDNEKSLNIAKLHRNRVACLLTLGRYNQAEDASASALEFDQDCAFSHFTAFKVAIAKCDQIQAIQVINRLSAIPAKQAPSPLVHNIQHALICLAAQIALEQSQRDVAMTTLRYLATLGKQDAARLTAYRCLVRLYLTLAEELESSVLTSNAGAISNGIADVDISKEKQETDQSMEEDTKVVKNKDSMMNSAVDCVFEAYEVLKQLHAGIKSNGKGDSPSGDILRLPGGKCDVINEDQLKVEVAWFMKIAWNMALQFNQDPLKMKKIFYLCKQLLDLVSPDEGVLLRQKTCLLMCASCALSIARTSTSSNESRIKLEEVLDITITCRDICERLTALRDPQIPQKEDKSSVILALYRFEALAKLTKPDDKESKETLHKLFEEITNLSTMEAKTFETIAALSMEKPAHHPVICKKSLRFALKDINRRVALKSNEAEKIAWLKRRCSLYCLLVDVSLKEASTSDPASKEESWNYFNEFYQLLQQDDHKFSELDSLWFTVQCWNTGIHLFIANHVIAAERWCALALRLLALLDRFKSSYENQMNFVYREILSKKHQFESNTASLIHSSTGHL